MSSQQDVTTTLPDHPDRVAIAAADGRFDLTVFGDAGAGTGKTTALVDRIVNLVASGVDVTAIAAITFTEAAAGELRHRVRTALELRRRDLRTPAGDGTHGDRDALDRLDRALASIDDAQFTTLHGFAHRILADHPLQAGVSPRFEVLDGLAAAAQFDRRFEAWLANLGARPEARPMLEEMHLLGITIRRVRRLAEAMVADEPRIPAGLAREPHAWAPPDPDLGRLLAGLDRLDQIVAGCASPVDRLLGPLHRVVQLGGHVRTWHADGGVDRNALYTILGTLCDAMKLGSGGRASSWPEFESAKAVRDEVKAVVGKPAREVLDGSTNAVLAELTRWVAWFVADWRAHRWASSTLAFQDLLTGARALLRRDPNVRAAVAARHRHILVDEFQDTDPVQVDLAFLLAAEGDGDGAGAATPASWERATVQPGRLFFVGDPKQSIYRFRGADIAVYEGVKDRVLAMPHGRLHQLTHNFRSVPGVLDWVNTVFDELLEPRHLAQPGYRPLTAQRAAVPGAGPPVRWFGGDDDLNAQDQRQLQAADVARVVHDLVGRHPVLDGDTVRPARHDDIAVIVRRHATARQVERAFEDADLPYVVQAASLVYGTQEVRDLRTILTALDDPQDDIAVVGALRHPALGCTDADLTTWAAASGSWLVPDQPHAVVVPTGVAATHPVARALTRLAALRVDRTVRSVAGYVEHVIEELGLMELALADGRARDRWRRLRHVADRAHEWHEGGGSLRGFLRWLREQDDQDVTTREQVVVDPDDDAVRITTIHAAKGLEYPIVILLGTDMDATRGLRDPVLLWGRDGTPQVNLGRDLKTAGYARLLRGDGEDLVGAREHHAYEERRLAYVGATRARDLLVVSLHHSSPKSLAAELVGRFGGRDDLWAVQATPGLPDRRPDLWRVWMGGDEPIDELVAWTARHEATARQAASPRTVAATTIAALVAPEETEASEAPEALRPAPTGGDTATVEDHEGPDAWRRTRGGSAIGRAVHAVLEVIDLGTLAGLDAQAATHAAAEGLPSDDGPRVAERVRRAAAAPIVRDALRGRTWRELYVGAPIPVDEGDPEGRHITVEGFIDLLAEVDGRLVIVDWKTDSAGARTPAEVAQRYHPQAATYALAVEQVTGRQVDRCVFVLTGMEDPDGREVEVAGAELAAATATLRTALAAVGSA